MKDGTYTVGPDGGSLLVTTRRQGAASRIGHDLVLEATAWSATFVVDERGPAHSSLEAVIDARSLVVRSASGGAVPLTDGQREEIARTIRGKVLRADQHSEITARSTAVSGSQKAATVTIDLTVAGVKRSATLAVVVAATAGGDTVSASTTLVQSDFGIKPYSAFLGALRVRDAVEVTVEVRLPPA